MTPIVVGPEGEPLSVGRARRTIPAPMRRAIMQRDQHCRFPGCDRPVAWTDGHHLAHWIDGGPTALWNVWLLCRLCRRRHKRYYADLAFMPSWAVAGVGEAA